MSLKTDLIDAIGAADITQDDWVEDIRGMVPSGYKKGLFDTRLNRLTDELLSSTENFRNELIDVADEVFE